jgi:hypothetical protein
MADFETLIDQIPDTEFRNLTRSTIPLLCYWREVEPVLSRFIARIFRDSRCPSGDLCFEYPVKSLGRSKPSFTDIMYLADQMALGVEGKSTEPRYDTVGTWLGKGRKHRHREEVLYHWLDLIRRRTGTVVSEMVPECVYQMVHRTASVCSTDRKKCAVLYQVFSVKSHGVDYRGDLSHLAKAIGAEGKLAIWLHEVEVKTTDWFAATRQRLRRATCQSDRVCIVRSAILDARLFAFAEKGLHRISDCC